MTPRFKRNAGGSYEIGEPSEREGLCEALRKAVSNLMHSDQTEFTMTSLASELTFDGHTDLAKAVELGVEDAKRARELDDGIINIGRLDLPPSILNRENSGLPQGWFFYSFPPTFEMEMSTLPLAEIEPPAHDFTEEEIEAVKDWRIRNPRRTPTGVVLFLDQRSPLPWHEANFIPADRARAIARYLAEKEESAND